jgi:transcriptional regulator with PAS, ATPase and Fis domain
MQKKQVLVSWIGHTDIRAMGRSLPPDRQQALVPLVGPIDNVRDKTGPVRTLLDCRTFDHVHLISDYPAAINRDYRQWVACSPTIHSVNIKNPTDYKDIFLAVDAVMKGIVQDYSQEKVDLAILLSPGTPAMAAIWVLLGKSRYPAQFYQTYEGKAWETEIPFDLTVDFLPELLRGADTTWQHLAALSPQEVEGFKDIVGDSRTLRVAVGRAWRVAFRDVPVLLLGESGTGKEMFARAIRAASRRRNEPFIPINCAAIPRDLLESELFGHVRGAYTGAIKDRDGAFLQANRGTLFLDEIGDCDPAIQAKLLRVLQPLADRGPCARAFSHVGASEVIESDVRVITATNRNLMQMVGAGEFREDLFYRLAVVTIHLPALRERKSDIPALAQSFLDKVNQDFAHQEPGYKPRVLSASAHRFLKHYPWPGNVRQLNNAILQAAVMAQGESLTAEDLTAAIADVPRTPPKDDVLSRPLGNGFCIEQLVGEVQTHYLQRAMKEAGGNKSKAARLLGVDSHQTLDGQLKRLGVKWKGDDP